MKPRCDLISFVVYKDLLTCKEWTERKVGGPERKGAGRNPSWVTRTVGGAELTMPAEQRDGDTRVAGSCELPSQAPNQIVRKWQA